MMPRANTDMCSSAPPENMSMKPNSVPLARAKKAASAAPSMPGVGMCTPIRYTASSKNEIKMRLRSSGIKPLPTVPEEAWRSGDLEVIKAKGIELAGIVQKARKAAKQAEATNGK